MTLQSLLWLQHEASEMQLVPLQMLPGSCSSGQGDGAAKAGPTLTCFTLMPIQPQDL